MLPQKRFFRQRAHSNPIADHILEYPSTPDEFNWNDYYPSIDKDATAAATTACDEQPSQCTGEPACKKLRSSKKCVNFLDIGCGYGGLLVELSPMFPDKLILGMEIRVKVSTYVQERIKGLRKQAEEKSSSASCICSSYENIACIRSNAMKHLPNFFRKGQIEKMFFLFPDPHFKKHKHKWRIISPQLLSEYAYVLAIGARVYLATDVEDLYNWMIGHFNDHPLFEEITKDHLHEDIVVDKLFDSTEEGKKVTRSGGKKFIAVYIRVDDPFNNQ